MEIGEREAEVNRIRDDENRRDGHWPLRSGEIRSR
jgi:hypothetical protein